MPLAVSVVGLLVPSACWTESPRSELKLEVNWTSDLAPVPAITVGWNRSKPAHGGKFWHGVDIVLLF